MQIQCVLKHFYALCIVYYSYSEIKKIFLYYFRIKIMKIENKQGSSVSININILKNILPTGDII